MDVSRLIVVSTVQMPRQFMYTLHQPDSLAIESVSLMRLEPEVCMQGLSYSVTFRDEEIVVTESSEPMRLVLSDQDKVKTEFSTVDPAYAHLSLKLVVQAQL